MINQMNHFSQLNSLELCQVYGGYGWADALLGLLGGLAPSPTLDQLNGQDNPNRHLCTCSPYGTGGSPNACNFC